MNGSATVLRSNRPENRSDKPTWRNKPLLQSMPSQEENMLPNFETIRPIRRSEIPLTRGRGNNKGLRGLQIVREFAMLLTIAKERGINPYEIAAEIDMTGEEVKQEMTRRKSFNQSFRTLLRAIVKQHEMENVLDVIEYNRGKQYFIVGRAS
jgi:hypothetical protein